MFSLRLLLISPRHQCVIRVTVQFYFDRMLQLHDPINYNILQSRSKDSTCFNLTLVQADSDYVN